MKIHPSAIVHADAELAHDVEVQAFSIIGPKVRIGEGTVVGSHCVIDGDTIVGENNQFFSGAQIGVPSQDLKHNTDLYGRTVLGNDNVIREFVTITASTMETARDAHRLTSVGNSCLVMSYAHIGHDCHLGNEVILASYVGLSGHVDVHDRANLAGHVGVQQFITIGSYSFCGGKAGVRTDVPPYMIVDGIPSRCVGPNLIGLERNGFDKDARNRVKQMYKIMYRSNLNVTQALDEIDRSIDDSRERAYFTSFYQKSRVAA